MDTDRHPQSASEIGMLTFQPLAQMLTQHQLQSSFLLPTPNLHPETATDFQSTFHKSQDQHHRLLLTSKGSTVELQQFFRE
jgi:hypothetical protein